MAEPLLHSPTNPHFFQPLLPGFNSHLSFPLKFLSKHIEGKTERNTVDLRSDTFKKTWKVKMEGRRLTAGWKEFAGAHGFKIGDIIIFRHEGDLVLHVSGFGPSCCEIQYAKDNIRNLTTEQNLETEAEFSSHHSWFEAKITDANLREDRKFFPKKFFIPDSLKKSNKIIITDDDGERRWELDLLFRESSGTFYMRLGWRSFCHDNGLEPGDSVSFKLERNNSGTPLLRFFTAESESISTKDGGKRMRKSGEKFVTLTATPAGLKRGRLYFPIWFTRGNGMESAGGKKITLLDKHGGEWPANLLMIFKGQPRMYLGFGSKEFVKAIGVKANESFELELVWEDKTIAPMFQFCSKVKTSL